MVQVKRWGGFWKWKAWTLSLRRISKSWSRWISNCVSMMLHQQLVVHHVTMKHRRPYRWPDAHTTETIHRQDPSYLHLLGSTGSPPTKRLITRKISLARCLACSVSISGSLGWMSAIPGIEREGSGRWWLTSLSPNILERFWREDLTFVPDRTKTQSGLQVRGKTSQKPYGGSYVEYRSGGGWWVEIRLDISSRGFIAEESSVCGGIV